MDNFRGSPINDSTFCGNSIIASSLLCIPLTSFSLQSKSCHGSAEDMRNNLTVSAPYLSIASLSKITLPLDEDIFCPSRSPIPNTVIPFGQYFCGNIAAWWNMWNDK